MRVFKYLIILVILIFGFLHYFEEYLDDSINRMIEEKYLGRIFVEENNIVRNRGDYFDKYLSEKGYIILFGSSDLSQATIQNPNYYFNSGITKKGILPIGRAYTQSFQHATTLGSITSENANKDVAIMMSMQWFMEKEGVKKKHFQANFSSIQFYNLLRNKKISMETKSLYAKRVIELLDDNKDFIVEKLYAMQYTDDGPIMDLFEKALSPFFYVTEKLTVLKDKGATYKMLIKLDDKLKIDGMTVDKNIINTQIFGKAIQESMKKAENHSLISLKGDNDKGSSIGKNTGNSKYDKYREIDWKKERKKAIKNSKYRVGDEKQFFAGKRYFVDRGYFKGYLKNKEKPYEKLYKYVDFSKAKEYEDFKIFLKICRDLNIKPTIIMTPSMDEFYNYVGVNDFKRHVYYNNMRKIASRYNTTFIDLSIHDKTRYYLKDVMHIGDFGWEDICQKLYTIYETKTFKYKM